MVDKVLRGRCRNTRDWKPDSTTLSPYCGSPRHTIMRCCYSPHRTLTHSFPITFNLYQGYGRHLLTVTPQEVGDPPIGRTTNPYGVRQAPGPTHLGLLGGRVRDSLIHTSLQQGQTGGRFYPGYAAGPATHHH